MSRKNVVWWVLVSVVIASGCGGAPLKPDLPPLPEISWDGDQRLEDTIVPVDYELELELRPSAERFSGRVVIAVDVKQPARRLRMHGEGMTIASVDVVQVPEVEEAKEGEEAPAPEPVKMKGAATVVGGGGLVIDLPQPLAPGRATITIAYDAPLLDKGEGLYRVEEGGDWYAFTQFEPLEARKAFPSFDEPRFKTPFRTTLVVPTELVAASNGPEEETKAREGGLKAVRFAQTRPLPTYLVAFAVGPFDVVEAPKGAIPGVPFRILTARGKGEKTGFALDKTPGIVKSLTAYFGQPFPFAKLDMVAVPNFNAGAMENVGLVTYRERLLLLDEEQASARQRYSSQSVIAHELAHMWFGNLVTMAWWDDLWLNEAFATWMATRVLSETAPELEADLGAVTSAGWVMGSDALKKARAIRQPIANRGDIYNAFDGITYTKGQAVLRMFEAWMGRDAFREGVRAYMKAHAYGTATTADLLRAFDASSGKPVTQAIATFLDQPGTPLVEVTPTCSGSGPLLLQMRQSRYLPAGSEADPGSPWSIPMCVRLGGMEGGATRRECLLFAEPEAVVTLPVKSCPTWVHPNADEAGYYHWNLPEASLVALATTYRAALTLPERIGMLNHVAALVESQDLKAAQQLAILDGMSAERHRLIVGHLVGALGTLDRLAKTDAQRAGLAAVTRRWIGPVAQEVGFHPKKGEPVDVGLLRPQVIGAMLSYGEDAALLKEARKVVNTYLDAPEVVSGATLSLALPHVAKGGDQALWDALRSRFAKERDPVVRRALLGGLAHVHDPRLLRASLGLVGTEAFRSQDVWSMLWPGMGDEETRDVAWGWLMANYGQVRNKLGDGRAGRLAGFGRAFCSEEKRKEVEVFFSAPERDATGLDRTLSMALESIDRCVRSTAWIEEDVHGWLERNAPAKP